AAAGPLCRAGRGWRPAQAGWPGPASRLLPDHAELLIRAGCHSGRQASLSAARWGIWLGRVAVRAGRRWQVVDGEGAFAAQVAGEGEPPAQNGPEAVAVAGEEPDVDEQPYPPADEAAEVQPESGNNGAPSRDVGGRAQIAVAEGLVVGLAPGQVADPAGGVEPGLHRDLGDPGQLVQAHQVP